VNICSFSKYFPTNLGIVGFSKVIWLGDLNYRIALSYADTKKLLMENDWDALFEKDQVTFWLIRNMPVLEGGVGGSVGLLWVYICFFSECQSSRIIFLLGKISHQRIGVSSKYASFKELN
jgi:hypothetical protein